MYQNSNGKRTLKIISGNTKQQILEAKLEMAVQQEKYEQASAIQKQLLKMQGK